MKILKTGRKGTKGTEALLAQLRAQGSRAGERVAPAVRRIVDAVRKYGDRALRKYAIEFDGLEKSAPFWVEQEALEAAWNSSPPDLKAALTAAAQNITRFAERQKQTPWDAELTPGLHTGVIFRPLDSVGCYAPGGRYPLPSTVLMTVIPARVAGVARIVVVSPRPAQATLAAAWIAGATEMFSIGGAQAISALAYGTESLARVDKIVGPGNSYVTQAKRMVAFDCSIDMLAGPTEIVIASQQGNARWLASDLVAQAEHDPEALAILITPNSALAKNVAAEVKTLAKGNTTAQAALKQNGLILLCDSADEMRDLTNRIAPEHLTVDRRVDLLWVRHAGSVFIGGHSPQPMGDYISGPNHVLPTAGLARTRAGLSVADFSKAITVQEYSPAALASLGPSAITLAEAEGLDAHAQAIRERMRP